jgi:hypothetical protein
MSYQRIKRRKHRPIPFVISFELAFLDEDLSLEEYESEVRRVVREKLPELDLVQNTSGTCGLWEEYDDFVSEIISEELQRN